MNKLNNKERVAQVLKTSRYHSGLSQEAIAKTLKVSKKTVQNWENATFCPSFVNVFDWLEATEQPPYPYIMAYLHTKDLVVPKHSDDGHELKKALSTHIDNLGQSTIEKLLYCLTGRHGSSPNGVIDAFICYLHLPLMLKVCIANTICTNYEFAKATGTLINADTIQPDITALKTLIKTGHKAVVDGKTSYMFSEVDS